MESNLLRGAEQPLGIVREIELESDEIVRNAKALGDKSVAQEVVDKLYVVFSTLKTRLGTQLKEAKNADENQDKSTDVALIKESLDTVISKTQHTINPYTINRNR